ncbi:MAG: glycosyltransferase family 2 protein, partial [Halarchaeum sp.]
MRVSVVIPTIDEPDELRECFDCLVAQDYDDFDVLVVDSGSGVNQRVVDDYADRLDARMLSTPKNGLPRARNTALAKLDDADIVAFCDPDARPVPEWLAALAAEYDDGVGAVGGPVLRPGETLCARDEVGVIRSNGEVVANFDADDR